MVRLLLLPLPLLVLLSSTLATVQTHAAPASTSSLDPQIDPLADTQPPRYAIESDDEEDEVPTSIKPLASSSPPTESFPIKFQGPFAQLTNRPLLIASGAAGRAYALGASLGEQAGAVGVSGVQMGLLFAPQNEGGEGNGALVLVSEALSSLPLAAMAPYAKEVLGALKPSSIALLDTYTLPGYASTEATSASSSVNAPVRYLASEGTVKPPAESGFQPFSPPNLQMGTSAAFLSLSAFSSPSSTTPSSTSTPEPGTPKSLLILLPSPHTPAAPPKSVPQADFSLLPSSNSHESSNDVEWDAETMNRAHEGLMAQLGVKGARRWEVKGGAGSAGAGLGAGAGGAQAKRRKESEVGDGGMYI